MITTQYEYSSGTGFTYNASDITFSNGNALLLLTTNSSPLTFSQNYASGSGFTYNSSNTEFTSGTMNQTPQSPASLAAYFQWSSQLNGNYGTGSLTVTATNGAAISNSVLNLTGSNNAYVTLPSTYAPAQINTYAFNYIPNYTGSPSSEQAFFTSNTGTLANLFKVSHLTGGTISFLMYNSSGIEIASQNFASWSPTSGTTYQFIFQFDWTNGSQKCFINGTQLGGTSNFTGTRTSSTSFYVGHYAQSTTNANFSIANFAIYNSILSPAVINLPTNNYNADNITLPAFSYAGPGNILSFNSATITDTNSPGYIVNQLYWNGTAWVASNGTYAQSNSAATVVSHISALPLANNVQVNVITNTSMNTQMSCSLFSINYTGQLYNTSNPTIAPIMPLTMNLLSSFIDIHSASGSDGIGWYLLLGATNYYWNGSIWTSSNGSYAQSNTASVINANAASLPISLGSYVTPYAILHSNSGATTPSLTSLSLIYNYFAPPPMGPNQCTIYGYLYNEAGVAVNGAIMTVTNPTTFVNQGIVQVQGTQIVQTNIEGYFSITLYETTTENMFLTWSVVYPFTGVPSNTFSFGKCLIPNSPLVNFANLTFS